MLMQMLVFVPVLKIPANIYHSQLNVWNLQEEFCKRKLIPKTEKKNPTAVMIAFAFNV